MKNVVILLEKGDLLVRTVHIDANTVQWVDGERELCDVLGMGFKVRKENNLKNALKTLEHLRDDVCYGYKPTGNELLDLIKLLREY